MVVENSMVILTAGQEVLGMLIGSIPPGDKETLWWNDEVKDVKGAKKMWGTSEGGKRET